LAATSISASFGSDLVFTQSEVKKIGHSIIYLSQRIDDLSKTKLLKLIYLTDELSVKSRGIPFFNLEYKIWQKGPVNVDLYSEFTSTPTILKDFIKLEFTDRGETYIKGKIKFDDGEFSDNEMNLLDLIISAYGDFTANKLVELCHRPNTLWHKIAEEKGLLEAFKTGKLTTTDFEINLQEYIKGDKLKESAFLDHIEYLQFSKRFKA